MLFAIIKKTNKPIKIVSWLYTEPGFLDSVTDSTGKTWKPRALIPIGFKRYRKMIQDAKPATMDNLAVAASVALNYEVCLVSPQAWKKHFNLIGTEKTASVDLAADIFGQEQFKFKKDHNKADSALIACYGAQVT